MLEHVRDRSIVCQFVSTGRERVQAAVEHSTLGRLLGMRSLSQESGRASLAAILPPRLKAGIANSTLRTAAEPVTAAGAQVHQAVADARLASLGTQLRRYVESSAGYRWLTAEPEPDVIVIDLRETRTVGPVIGVMDRTLRGLTMGAPTSVITAVATSVAMFGCKRPLRAASLVALPVILGSLLAGALTGTVSTAVVALHLLLAVFSVLGLRSTATLEDLRETRTARLLAAVFEPPEPPVSDPCREPADAVDSETEADDVKH